MNDREDPDEKILEKLRPPTRITASPYFRERVMKAINEEGSKKRFRFGAWPGWVTAGCTVALLLLLVPMLHIGRKARVTSPAGTLWAQSVEALANAKSVHIVGRIRTIPGDNFELIGTQYDFVPIEIWREYTNPPRWRVEKPGRTVVMDGKSATLYLAKANTVSSGPPGAGYIEWLRPMLDPQSILQSEMAAAQATGIENQTSEANGVLNVTVKRKAGGNFANDWAKNKSVQESDHSCIYHFDSATKRLVGLEVYVSSEGKDSLVAEFSDIRYNETFQPSLFALQIPSNATRFQDASEMKPAAVTLNGPKDAAAYFFDSLAHERWDDVLAVFPVSSIKDAFKKDFGGLQVVSLGEPFQSGLYPGYFVPYEVRLPGGSSKKHNLAVRNDNPQHKWMVDGGF
jgi:outer membrane lipoprotein-sorting protein